MRNKCVDDVLGWAESLTQLFFDVCHFLYNKNSHGVIQNPAKFIWGRQEIDYLGFKILKDGVRPTDEMFSAIADFPRPSDITGVHAWFGLVEQVSFAFSKSQLMTPFRKLLVKNAEYLWDEELQHAFKIARKEIVQLVSQ